MGHVILLSCLLFSFICVCMVVLEDWMGDGSGFYGKEDGEMEMGL